MSLLEKALCARQLVFGQLQLALALEHQRLSLGFFLFRECNLGAGAFERRGQLGNVHLNQNIACGDHRALSHQNAFDAAWRFCRDVDLLGLNAAVPKDDSLGQGRAVCFKPGVACGCRHDRECRKDCNPASGAHGAASI